MSDISDDEIDLMLDEPLTDDDMADPVEMRQLELLEAVVAQLAAAVQGLQVVAQQLAQVAQINAAPRETTMVARDGRQLRAVSQIKPLRGGGNA